MELDLDHLRGWIGREERAEEVLTPSLVQRFDATFDRTSQPEAGAEAPLLIHLCLCQPAAPTSALGPDGHPTRGGFLPQVPLPRRMWAGGSFDFHAPIRVGATVTRRSTIRDVMVKQGRSGPLCFVTVEHRIASDGTPALTERQDIVYRGVGTPGGAVTTAPEAPRGTHERLIAATPALLFRYSALTFNGHRIHYDAPYVRDEEGYPGLIVHGPLQATWLCRMAADLQGDVPTRFAFRSRSSLFDTDDVVLHATSDGDATKLWTARPDGPVAMEATATWG